MGKTVLCCINNFQQFQYGEVLQELADSQHDVRLDRCQNQCVGCRNAPTAIVDGRWMTFDDPEEMRQYVLKGS